MFAKMFVTLSVVEPGINWTHHGFRWSLEDSDPWIPGWECTAQCMPGRGVLQLTYCSGDGTRKDGFDTHLGLRKALCYLTRISELELVEEEAHVSQAEAITPFGSPVGRSVVPTLDSDERDSAGKGGKAHPVSTVVPGISYIEHKTDMFRKYLGTNNVQAALDFAKHGTKPGAAGKGKKKK